MTTPIAELHPADTRTNGINALDLDAVKAAGLNSLAVSALLLAEHANREHADVLAHFRRRELA